MAVREPDTGPVPRRGARLHRYGKTVLLVGGVGGVALDGLTWLITREGSVVRAVLGAGLAGVALVLLVAARLIDRFDAARLRRS